ncbi:MAG: tryptophan--tRNA ligase [Patescibacteria group bacterium]|nr:MAG: tryptophan--tRNA ligase [Patescibacteria group bacterium]
MKKRILTGDNTTGRLHLGHYVGSLENRVKLQDSYETFVILADAHSLAYPKYIGQPDLISDSILQVAIDNLSVGLAPEKVTLFAESTVPEIYEIALLLSMLVPYPRILRNPTIKDEIREKELGDNYSMGFLNFPIMMASDILSVRADLVPVGEDQEPHLELTREIVRKFNSTYGEVFKEPEAMIGRVARLVGLDGSTKMTKSLNNAIFLSDDEKTVRQKVLKMYTDPNRLHPTDPGKVEGNPVFIYHDAFNDNKEEVEDLKKRYVVGRVGDVEVKERLIVAIEKFLAPIRERRAKYEADLDTVHGILIEGAKRTRKEAAETLNLVREKMKLPRF